MPIRKIVYLSVIWSNLLPFQNFCIAEAAKNCRFTIRPLINGKAVRVDWLELCARMLRLHTGNQGATMRFQAPESLSEQIAQHLGQQIINGTMEPGERIQELKVAGELDVSRGSVREALLILERRHLIQIYPRKGAVVSVLTPELVNNLYDIYVHLLLMLAEKVIENRSAENLKPLMEGVQSLRRRIVASDATTQEVTEKGFDIMRLCYPIVNNPYLEETLENFRPALSRTYYLALEQYRDQAEATDAFFARVFDQINQGSYQEVARLIREFGERQRQTVLQALAKRSKTTTEAIT